MCHVKTRSGGGGDEEGRLSPASVVKWGGGEVDGWKRRKRMTGDAQAHGWMPAAFPPVFLVVLLKHLFSSSLSCAARVALGDNTATDALEPAMCL